MSDKDMSSGVGYGKPPKDSQFKKGVSGNPRGRPKLEDNLFSIIQNELKSKIISHGEDGPKQITKSEAIIKVLVNRCLKGDMRALEAVMRLTEKAELFNKALQDEDMKSDASARQIMDGIRTRLLQTSPQSEVPKI